MEMTKTTHAKDRSEWRGWLEKHHTSETEVWLIYYKKGSGKTSISYPDSLEEALCFGWIDSIIQKIDDEQYARKFTPRREGSRWSEVNKRLVSKLAREGRMREAGLALVDFTMPESEGPRPKRSDMPLPDWLKEGLMTSPPAWENFTRLPPSHRRQYIGWISAAKREETRQRRLQEAIIRLERNERLGMK
jgi:uncharacterized protein YdeI (YjbR/CyaY-like superfamily)